MMEQMTSWSRATAAVVDDDDDDKTTSSTRRLIDAIVTSDHPPSQWKFTDVQYRLLFSDKRDGHVKQVSWKAVLTFAR